MRTNDGSAELFLVRLHHPVAGAHAIMVPGDGIFTWPPPPKLYIRDSVDSPVTEWALDSYSLITDEEIATMPHSIRGANYIFVCYHSSAEALAGLVGAPPPTPN